MVYGNTLLMCQGSNTFVGSNPTSSAFFFWRGRIVVYSIGFENRRPQGLVGSNPTPSAKAIFYRYDLSASKSPKP